MSSTLVHNDPDRMHVPSTVNRVVYTYRAKGNMVVRSRERYAYDAENRLTQVKKNGAVIATFVYDGDGQRVKATFGGTTTVYIGNYYEQTGSTIRKYYYAGGRRVAMRENSTVYYLLTDHLGSTALTVSSGGTPCPRVGGLSPHRGVLKKYPLSPQRRREGGGIIKASASLRCNHRPAAGGGPGAVPDGRAVG